MHTKPLAFLRVVCEHGLCTLIRFSSVSDAGMAN